MLKKVGHNDPKFLRVEDTLWLQLQSIDRFAHALGYKRNKGSYYCTNVKSDKSVVSFKLMKVWHNREFRDMYLSWHGFSIENLSQHWRLPLQRMKNAIDVKIVKDVKVSWSKRKQVFCVEDHQVSFV